MLATIRPALAPNASKPNACSILLPSGRRVDPQHAQTLLQVVVNAVAARPGLPDLRGQLLRLAGRGTNLAYCHPRPGMIRALTTKKGGAATAPSGVSPSISCKPRRAALARRAGERSPVSYVADWRRRPGHD